MMFELLVVIYFSSIIFIALFPTVFYLTFYTDEDGSALGIAGYLIMQGIRRLQYGRN